MRKILLIIAMAGICQLSNAQAVEQGNVCFDISYGFPNLWSSVLKSALVSGDVVGVDVGSIGPVAGKFEYMVADKIGVGVILNYANTSVSWTDTYNVWNQTTGVSVPTTFDYKVSAPRLRVMGKFSFHYGNSDSFDGYTTIAAGYGSLKFKIDSSDPDYSEDDFSLNATPVAIRIATGGKYYFSDNFGIHMEFGIGGGGLDRKSVV